MIFSSFYFVLSLESRTILLLGGSNVVVRYFVYVVCTSCWCMRVLLWCEKLSGQLQILLPVFTRVRSTGLRFNLKKCSFFQEEVTFLGHRVSAEGFSPDETKLVAVRNWKTPKSVTAVPEFIGFAGYYRHFIRGFTQHAAPLTALTGKNARFAWSKACEAAFACQCAGDGVPPV